VGVGKKFTPSPRWRRRPRAMQPNHNRISRLVGLPPGISLEYQEAAGAV
jgi:hypothetical protein